VLVREITGYNRNRQIKKAIFEAYKHSPHLVLKATITVCTTQKSQCATSVKFIIPKTEHLKAYVKIVKI
jgi:hypothetical protein